jgi:hypothetical protein
MTYETKTEKNENPMAWFSVAFGKPELTTNSNGNVSTGETTVVGGQDAVDDPKSKRLSAISTEMNAREEHSVGGQDVVKVGSTVSNEVAVAESTIAEKAGVAEEAIVEESDVRSRYNQYRNSWACSQNQRASTASGSGRRCSVGGRYAYGLVRDSERDEPPVPEGW